MAAFLCPSRLASPTCVRCESAGWHASDDFFGLERVKTVFASAAALPPEAAADALLNAIDVWSRQQASDDLTIVLVDTQAVA